MGNGLPRKRHRRLTPEQEQELARRAQSGSRAAVNELVECNRALAIRIASKYTPNKIVDRDDIVQLAMLGLIRAASGYEPRGVRFSVYATHWVRARIQDGLRRTENETTGMPRDHETHRYIRRKEPSVPVNEWLLYDNTTPEDEAAQNERRDRLAAALKQLPARWQRVMRLRLEGVELQQVGDRLGVSKERVRQIQVKAIERLRKLMAVPE